ncbi:glycosyltransferase [candidate division WWE3 bacterium CG10_big_fil_rev_8_21_14_0_10_32_10]|uniref:Glycosyltransferase n=1 Tax=candidate division WWE3 bacterium CG10_big_fil_rev_8_21_14_0_10_32_10 TaxID=1975090 RepID=A0A2H0RC05_UNCKA|nr:MAG: glycosyltransferase [candidate division WWE3 bacterium CG10_big_fil_rev_8_21_14_0_10_32_10]
MKNKKTVSVVIPCYNEEKNIERFPKELIEKLDAFNFDYEILAVDDGSNKDDTWRALKKLSEKHNKFKAFKHSRNYGMGAAYQTAFDEAIGDYIVTFSSDLETPAEYIKEVVDKLEEGNDLVNTYRTGRWQESKKGSLVRRIPSNIANGLIEKVSGVKVNDTGSGVKGFRRFIIDNLRIYGDMHRFLPAYSSLYTTKIVEIPVDYQERKYGTPAYGSLKRTFSVILDLFSMKFMLSFATKPFSMMPGRLFGTTGIFTFLLGSLITLYMIFIKFVFGQSIGDRPMFIGGLMLLMFGVQLIMTGLLGELMMRIYFESSGKKPYIVSEKS